MDETQLNKVRLGGCQCGAIRYEVTGPILKLVVCHCTECRKQSASAFGVAAFVKRDLLRVTKGTPKSWSRLADSGNVVECAFCPDCGSRLWHQRAIVPDTTSIRGGSFDEPLDLVSAVHIWTSRKLKGVIIPDGTVQFERGPD